MSALLPGVLVGISAVVVLALGMLHLAYTFRGRKLHPVADAVGSVWSWAGDMVAAIREDLGWLTQTGYDRLLAACDFNLVRGEDSLVRAIWAGRPFAWQIYPQDDDAHWVKLDAFLDQMEAPDDWRAFHAAWNAPQPQMLPPLRLEGWGQAALGWRQRLLAQDDLVTQLLRLARKKR